MSEHIQAMAQRIIKEVHRNDLQVTDVYAFILDAVKFYRQKAFFQSEGIYNFTTTAMPNPGTGNFIFPDARAAHQMPKDFIQMNAITVLFSGTALPLNKRSLAWFVEQCEGNPVVVGPPTDYMFYNGQVYFWPLADKQYQVTVWYTRASAAPDPSKPTDVDNFWMTDDREPMVRATAKALMYAQRLRDVKNAQVEQAIAQQFFTQIQAAAYGNLFTGEPQGHDW